MYAGSCTSCKQIYNLSEEHEELQSEVIHEEVEEEDEIEEEIKRDEIQEDDLSYLSQLFSRCETPLYDGNNFLPELEDMYIEEDEGDQFHFDEKLYMINRESKERVGILKIVVDHLGNADFFVLIKGEFSEGSKSYEVYNYGYVRKNFDSTEEARFEIENDHEIEKRTVHCLYSRSVKGKYVLTEQYRYNQEYFLKNRTELYYNDVVNVVTESVNIILMRQIAKKDFVGFKFVKSVITNREVCKAQMKCYPFVWCTVNGRMTELKRIRKKVIMPTKEVQESDAYLTRNGQVVLVIWCGEVYYAAVDQRVEIIPGYCPKNPYMLHNFLSRYHDRADVKKKIEFDTKRLVLESKNYIVDHPEVMAIISYMCKQILLTKPHNVVVFVKNCILPYL